MVEIFSLSNYFDRTKGVPPAVAVSLSEDLGPIFYFLQTVWVSGFCLLFAKVSLWRLDLCIGFSLQTCEKSCLEEIIGPDE